MSVKLHELLQSALAGMSSGPKPLTPAVNFYATQHGATVPALEAEISKRVAADANDSVRAALQEPLATWDFADGAGWTETTEPNTPQRRSRIYDLLALGKGTRKVLDAELPFYQGAEPILIQAPDAKGDWYTEEFKKTHKFYWSHLKTHLQGVRGLGPTVVAKLDAAADRVIERLGDPAAANPRRSRGLVVGYVQSGKTTNFTAVMAKAIDAGFRLIIVLSGTTNMLRNQTQRRVDMELVGVENILRGASELESDHEYKEDDAWKKQKFIRYGQQPSKLGWVDIVRLTTHRDFKGGASINQLDFEYEKRDKKRPLYNRSNLDHAGARIIVVKKQIDRLSHLLRELTTAGGGRCGEIPTIIIDDESDQASVNTVNPQKVPKSSEDGRTGINKAIVKLLERLPRAQYVGYTATPFANVFIDPDDVKDIYPGDFILSLDRPDNYMGAREFHDFDVKAPGPNERAYIRDIKGADDRLVEAIDAFVLTGALKAYREAKKEFEEEHHTMLVHASQLQDRHEKAVAKIRRLWREAGYDSPGPGLQRLKALFEGDFRNVWLERGKPEGLSYPSRFEALKPYIGKALDLIRNGGDEPVLMVNSAEGASVPNFDGPDREWKIIVGGAKLSRGYTVSGLTVSYFRRSSKMQDTLMQMGRWFGYRPGYGDLVRLYIGREEQDGQKGTLDLYEAFKAICADEEEFREQLKQYEKPADGSFGITPRDVPALVYNSHPRLRPSSRNKMHYAALTLAAFKYKEPTTQEVKGKGRIKNERLVKKLILSGRLTAHEVKVTSPTKETFKVLVTEAAHATVMETLKGLAWRKEAFNLAAELKYLEQADGPVDRWLVVAPQIGRSEAKGSWNLGATELQCVRRKDLGSRFQVFSDPGHRAFAKWLAGDDKVACSTARLKPGKSTGVLLLYPTYESEGPKGGNVPVMGFGLCVPADNGGARIAFRARSKEPSK